MRIKTAVLLILVFELLVSSFTVTGKLIVPPTMAGKPGAAAISLATVTDLASSAFPSPGVGVKVNVHPAGSQITHVNYSDYFYVMHGWVNEGNWSSYTADTQNAFLDPLQTNFTLETNSTNFQNPSLIQFTYYNSTADSMYTFFWFQFLPGDLDPGAYSFTGIWSLAAAANPPNYTATYFENTITLIVNQFLLRSQTSVFCSPAIVSVGFPVSCTATVSGSSPTGTITWSTSSSAGSFNQSICVLSNGSCTTMYTDNSSGSAIITGCYSGDLDNTASCGTFILTVTPSGPVYYTSNYTSVQATIEAASAGATVVVTQGFYNESLIVNKTLAIIGEKDPPVFRGGGSGIAITLLAGASGSIVTGILITAWDMGILVNNASGCKIYDNIMSSMNKNGIVLQGINAVNNQVYGNVFQQDAVAVYLTSAASNSTVVQNIIRLSTTGLKIETNQTTVCENIISGNQLGINLTNSNSNKIFHNTLADNEIQVSISMSTGNVWDDGYPAGGNYWSNHTGPDIVSGPSQDQLGPDGIVDTPYTVAIGAIDRYPLVEGAHDVGITSVTVSKTVVGRGYALRVELEISNYGMYDESCAVAAYANTSTVVTQNIALMKKGFIIVTMKWNTSAFGYGNYTISAYSQPVKDEMDMANNVYFDGSVIIAIPGDINGDGIVDIYDAIVLSGTYNSVPSNRSWNSNADINCDNIVDIYDAIIVANHFNQHYP